MNPSSIREIQEIVRQQARLLPYGGGSKTALSGPGEGFDRLPLAGLAGMLEYQPEEYTFTALAGTRLADVEQSLAEHGQYLPFDPPFVEGGATLGGTVASGLSGPGRYRYGGVRDSLLGIRFIDSQGQLIRSGGKVVKNAAGFDLSKLMVGSLGQYGALVELTFKVLPHPQAFATLRIFYPTLSDALQPLICLATSPLELFALDIEPTREGAVLLVRLGGLPSTLQARVKRVLGVISLEMGSHHEVLEGEDEENLWRGTREFTWLPEDHLLVKIPITSKRVLSLDTRLEGLRALRRYSVGANVAWAAWPAAVEDLDEILVDLGLSGLVVLGSSGKRRLGLRAGENFARRVKKALDPSGLWVEV
jgi:glycolate oxidase FAD binding subunit